ncbi:hypothetical protein [Pseudonocardia asaccharolytica]|uniref:Uncharacterized protein n=1 Tax=Pseudonocardia asaccharolytica DSM 44247 = NBRC 16224 TaxID=1123024 RepID=A0A511D706_9PSEU|nr:hypothetical protein [Pseudonocardia asaccharolytica]GEL20569.1 hypothetical protein PA7_44060 [Pseudonocardia asaccharolytica DSM 44247 = NBRC 16224]
MNTLSTVRSRTTAPPAEAAPLPSRVRARGDPDGWSARRREVIDGAAGVCALCGRPGADTAFRDWNATELRAAHTRCVVGLGPPPAGPGHDAA